MNMLHLLTLLFLIIHGTQTLIECLPSTLMTSGNETDRAALLALKVSLVGGSSDSQALLSSWNASTHFCKWVGVTCERGRQRVTVLDLGYRNTGGFISPFIGNLSFLRVINLSGNSLKGFIPREIGLLSRLEIFNVSNNALQGGFPLDLTNCSRLLTITVFANGLRGIIPDQLGSLPDLQTLYMGRNDFTGEIPSSLGNISSLSILGIAKNRLQGSIPSNLGKLKSLMVLSLQENSLSGTIHSSLYNLTSIQVLSLAVNYISGTVAPGLGVVFPHLRHLFFGGNNFGGVIPPTLSNISGLQRFDVITNQFYGNVPEGLGRLKDLELLQLEGNELGGGNQRNDLDFIISLTNLTDLKILNIYGNRFRGMIPDSVGNLSSKIEKLLLGSNMISGHIPVETGNLISLITLGIEDNHLTGEVPSSLGNLVALGLLTLGRNRLQGAIPSSLGNLKNLYNLGLEKNQLEGSIPLNIQNCSGLQELYLNDNKLNGTVSTEFISGLNQLIDLYLDDNFFTGYFPTSVGELMHLNDLDISNNKFSGEIPTELGKCSMLKFLRVQENFFGGRIPLSLSSLRSVQYLDLSSNNLSGAIPLKLQDIRSLHILNVSFNRLEGEVPTEGIFSNLTGISLQGNEKLCGGIPELNLPSCSSTDQVKNKKRRIPNMVIIAVTISIFFVFFLVLVFACVARRKVSKMTNAPDLSVVDGRGGQYLRLSYKQLRDATDQFSVANIIGVGSFGSVYSGTLGDKPIAVKVMNLRKRGAMKSFKTECKALSNIRHRNLLQILSCCSSLDFKGSDFMALVYELMPNGSLETWLHGSRIINLGQRLDIAIDVASALDYLHHDCEPRIVHCDLKPSNVLLDSHMVARVGDFGLAKIINGSDAAGNFSKEQSSSSLAIKGTVGYVPPEYGMGGNVSAEGDVYSYGILLLELITGRRPTDETFKDDTNLHIFCASAFSKSNIMEIVDSRLLTELDNADANNPSSSQVNTYDLQKMRECIDGIAEIGISCSKECPNERMEIGRALKMLQKIKIKLA